MCDLPQTYWISLQVEIVQYLIKAAADIHAKDAFDNTCLNDAVRSRFDSSSRMKVQFLVEIYGWFEIFL